jgi:hypothetical protein
MVVKVPGDGFSSCVPTPSYDACPMTFALIDASTSNGKVVNKAKPEI